MAKKFYVVWQGRQTGIFDNWSDCKSAVDGFAGARYKSYPTQAEAKKALSQRAPSLSSKEPNSQSRVKKITTQAPDKKFDVAIYCDGGCDPNPGQAGSGCAVYRAGVLAELWYGLYNPQGTNNTAELNALHQSLLIAQKAVNERLSVVIYCDSQYAINCISVWARGWEKNGWQKRGGDIKNLELIQMIYALYEDLKSKVQLQHVKAHVGIEGNELADRMTMIAVDRKELRYVPYKDPIDIEALLSLRSG